MIFLSISYFFTHKLRPSVLLVAKTSVEQIATRTVDAAILEKLTQDGISYETIVTVNTGKNNEVASLTTNTTLMNILKADILNLINQKIQQLSADKIGIPVGSLLNNELLAGRGPRIPIKLVPYGSATAEFESSFVSDGINQTRHKIDFVVNTKIAVLLPGMTSLTNIETTFPVGDTVIVGNVPNTYLDLQR